MTMETGEISTRGERRHVPLRSCELVDVPRLPLRWTAALNGSEGLKRVCKRKERGDVGR
jgi:hypothetical protein